MAYMGAIQPNIETELASAIIEGNLPTQAMSQARSIQARLKTVTQVTLFGHPGSGKSALLNILLGEQVLPLGAGLCTVQLVHGPIEQAEVTLRDGTLKVLDAPLEFGRIAAMNPAFVKVYSPLKSLTRISLLEVVAPVDRVQQIKAIKWAMKQTDVAIWCTQDFDLSEETLWAHVPDQVKDHAILALCNAERFGDDRGRILKRLSNRIGHEFAHVLAVSAEEALIAQNASDGIDKALLKSSGATRLISTIVRHIENGRQVALDQAAILLHRYKNESVTPQEPAHIDAPQVDVAPVAKAEVVASPTVASDVPKVQLPTEDFEFQRQAKAKPIGTMPQAVSEATAYLASVGVALTGMTLSQSDEILEQSAQATAWLVDHFNSADWPEDDRLDQVRLRVQDADDLIQLLGVENTQEGVVDAVTTMLQLKDELQGMLAA